MAIQIFGDIDRKPDGTIRSHMPAHENKQAVEELRESIRHDEQMIKDGWMPDEGTARIHLRDQKAKLEAVESGRPKPTTEQRDWAAKYRTYLKGVIGERLFTQSEMQMSADHAHEELGFMVEKTIPLDHEQAKESGVTLVNGKGSRTDAEIIYKHLSNALGENPSTEKLRRPGRTVQYDVPTQEFPGYDRRLPEHYKPEEPIPEIKVNSTFEHKGIEVEVINNKGGRPKGSKNKKRG